MPLWHIVDYFDIGPHSKAWTQIELDGFCRHYNIRRKRLRGSYW